MENTPHFPPVNTLSANCSTRRENNIANWLWSEIVARSEKMIHTKDYLSIRFCPSPNLGVNAKIIICAENVTAIWSQWNNKTSCRGQEVLGNTPLLGIFLSIFIFVREVLTYAGWASAIEEGAESIDLMTTSDQDMNENLREKNLVSLALDIKAEMETKKASLQLWVSSG